jgi:cellulose 1,4-beta-cellobiosidase
MKKLALVAAMILLATLPALADGSRLGATVVQTSAGPTVVLKWTQGTVPANSTCPTAGASTAVSSSNIYRATTPGGEPADGGTTLVRLSPAVTTYTDASALTPGTTYYYKVSAVNCNGESPQSNEASALIPNNAVPSAPTGLTATPTAASASITLKWQTVASNVPIFYNVFRAENKNTNYQRVNSARVKGTTYTDSALTAGNTYHYRVKSWTATGGGSAYSNTASAFLP